MPVRRRIISKPSRPKKGVREGKTAKAIHRYLRRYPGLRSRILQNLLVRLHAKGIVTVEEVYRVALGKAAFRDEVQHRVALNVDTARQWAQKDRQALKATVIRYADKHLTPEEIDDLVGVTAKREEAQNLEDIAGLPGVSFDILKRKIADFCKLPRTATPLPPSDAVATRVALMRQFVSDNVDYLTLARDFIRIRDLRDIADKTIGPRNSIGHIGGKAAGLTLAGRILEEYFSHAKRKPRMPIVIPESYYLRSDLCDEFVRRNGLMVYSGQKYKGQEAIEAEYPMIRELFHAGTFPADIVNRVKKLLERVGRVPLILRSSSLLEDNLGSAFSGKYQSIFLANQGSLANRTQRFLSAVSEIFASVLNVDPLLYRRERNLLDYDEFMAVLVQPVVGTQYRHFFFPLYAGVAFSRNDYYRWNRRIQKKDGFLRLVAGLGTRAVDRVSSDYPRMVALTAPSLRPQGNVEEIRRQAQRRIDVINLQTNQFETLSLQEVLGSEPLPYFDLVASKLEGDYFTPIVGGLVDPSHQSICLTFDKLVESTPFAAQMKEILQILEGVYKCPVDIEFASDGKVFYLLQCRPLAKMAEKTRVELPRGIDAAKVLFKTQRDVRNGLVKNIEYFIYVPPDAYDAVTDLMTKQTIGRVVSQLNQKLQGSRFVLMGPGRWGSNDINLGVRVNYADIRHARGLIEVSRMKEGYAPEVSFGTHFFLDLMESGIAYLPLYTDTRSISFREEFFTQSPNVLREMLPDRKQFERNVVVVHVPKVAEGQFAHLVMDGDSEQAICYLGPRDEDEITLTGFRPARVE